MQSLFQRLGIQEADSEQNRPAINHFMGALMQTLGQESSGQPLPQAIDAARTQLADGTQSTRLDALQSELDTLKGSLGNSDLNLDQLLYAFKQTLPQGPGKASASCSMPAREREWNHENGNQTVAVFVGPISRCHARTVKGRVQHGAGQRGLPALLQGIGRSQAIRRLLVLTQLELADQPLNLDLQCPPRPAPWSRDSLSVHPPSSGGMDSPASWVRVRVASRRRTKRASSLTRIRPWACTTA